MGRQHRRRQRLQPLHGELDGDGTFTIDEERAPTALRYNPPEAWYHLEGHLVDLDNDGDLDLALAQNRGLEPSTFNQSSIVLINDGTGHYPVRIELPRPAFADGYTSVHVKGKQTGP